jgi:hypothetical protein
MMLFSVLAGVSAIALVSVVVTGQQCTQRIDAIATCIGGVVNGSDAATLRQRKAQIVQSCVQQTPAWQSCSTLFTALDQCHMQIIQQMSTDQQLKQAKQAVYQEVDNCFRQYPNSDPFSVFEMGGKDKDGPPMGGPPDGRRGPPPGMFGGPDQGPMMGPPPGMQPPMNGGGPYNNYGPPPQNPYGPPPGNNYAQPPMNSWGPPPQPQGSFVQNTITATDAPSDASPTGVGDMDMQKLSDCFRSFINTAMRVANMAGQQSTSGQSQPPQGGPFGGMGGGGMDKGPMGQCMDLMMCVKSGMKQSDGDQSLLPSTRRYFDSFVKCKASNPPTWDCTPKKRELGDCIARTSINFLRQTVIPRLDDCVKSRGISSDMQAALRMLEDKLASPHMVMEALESLNVMGT